MFYLESEDDQNTKLAPYMKTDGVKLSTHMTTLSKLGSKHGNTKETKVWDTGIYIRNNIELPAMAS
jgi:hypothetical protein